MIRYESETETFVIDDPTEAEIKELDSKLKRVEPDVLRWFPPGITELPSGMKGAGDLVKWAADLLGFKQCGSCRKRQQWMNEHLPFPK